MNNLDNLHAKIDELNEQAYACYETDIELTKTLADEALALCEELESPYELGYARAQVMHIEWLTQRGDMLKVIEKALVIRDIYADYSADKWLVSNLYCLGVAFHHTGQVALALATHQEQLETARQVGIRYDEASALRRIGVAHALQNHHDLALKYYEQSAKIYTELNVAGGVAGVQINSAIIYHQDGNLSQALYCAEQALSVFKQIDLLSGQTVAHTHLANIYLDSGKMTSAEFHAQEALRLAREAKRTSRIISALNSSAKILIQQTQYPAALNHLTEAQTLAQEVADLAMQADCIFIISDAYEKMGDISAAFDAHRQFHTLKMQLLQDASDMRFESLEVLYQTREAQKEAENERRLREEDKRYYEQITQMKDDILSTASHDLKNPLGSIMMMSHLLRTKLVDESALQYLSNIDRSVERMRELVINLLDLARLEARISLKLRLGNLVNIVTETCTEFADSAQEKNITLTWQADEHNITVKFDKFRIKQVLGNLLSNAIKYTPENGHILVIVKRTEENLIIQVQDSGIGIPSDAIPYVFDRFYRVPDEEHEQIEGSGLGLAICKAIIDQHEGRIWVESHPNEGSIFGFTIPFEPTYFQLAANL